MTDKADDFHELITRAQAAKAAAEAEMEEEDVDSGAPSLEDLAAKSIKCVLNVRGIPIQAVVDPDAVTIRPMAAFTRLSRNEGSAEDLMELVRFIVGAIKWWNLRERRKEAGIVPLTEDRLADLGIPIVGAIMEALMAAMRMGEASGKPSKQPLSATPKRATKRYYAR